MKKSTEWCKDPWHCLFILLVIVTLGLVAYGLVPRSFFEDSVGAAWVQAIGSVLAIFVGFVQSSRERRFALEDAELKEGRRIEGIFGANTYDRQACGLGFSRDAPLHW